MNFASKQFAKHVYGVLFIGFILLLAADSFAGTDILQNFSFDDCDPFEARARIMGVHGKKAQLIAAEQTIYVVDMPLGDQQRLITEIADADGNPTDFGSLDCGQWVYVKGFIHVKGGVVASLVQIIDQPVRKKPVLRKIIKKTRRYERIRRRTAVIKP